MNLKALSLSLVISGFFIQQEALAVRCHDVVFAVSAAQGDLAKVKQCVLVDKRSPNMKDEMGSRPLIQAARKGHVKVVQFLLQNGADPNIPDKEGDTALHWVQKAGRNNTLITALLLNYGANPNYVTSWGSTPLIDAVRSGQTTNVIMLLEHAKVKAKANIYAKKGFTAIWHAVRSGTEYGTIIRVLARNGAHLNNPDNNGLTPLMRAVDKGYLPAARALLHNKADPNMRAKTKTQLTPLLIAVNADKNAVELVELLVQNGADINKGNHWGYTPLMRAASIEKEDVVRKLLLLGADEHRKTDNGATAMTYAKQKNNPAILKLLNIETRGDLEHELLKTAEDTAKKLTALR